MKKKTYEKIPAEKAKEFLRIYETIKTHHKRIKNILNNKDDHAVGEINKICKQIEKRTKNKCLTHGKEIKELLITDFFQSMDNVWIKKDFGTLPNTTEDGKLEVKRKKGRPKEDYALEVLIYLLALEYGEKNFESISNFLSNNEIAAGDDVSCSVDAVKKRLGRIKKDDIKKQYAKFVSASRETKILCHGGPDTTANIAVCWKLPLKLPLSIPLK